MPVLSLIALKKVVSSFFIGNDLNSVAEHAFLKMSRASGLLLIWRRILKVEAEISYRSWISCEVSEARVRGLDAACCASAMMDRIQVGLFLGAFFSFQTAEIILRILEDTGSSILSFEDTSYLLC